jgi:general secretion pathway protein J
MNSRRAVARAQAGFTLIEVLVALALMALVSLMAWRGLDSVSSARDWIARQADDTDAVVRTLGQMGRDVEMAYNGPSFAAPGVDAQVFTSGVRLLRGAAGAQTLEILRPAPDDDGRWQRVQWSVRKDGLWRASGLPAEQGPLPPVNDGVLLLGDGHGLGRHPRALLRHARRHRDHARPRRGRRRAALQPHPGTAMRGPP